MSRVRALLAEGAACISEEKIGSAQERTEFEREKTLAFAELSAAERTHAEAIDLLELWYSRWQGFVAGTPHEMQTRTRDLLVASGRDPKPPVPQRGPFQRRRRTDGEIPVGTAGEDIEPGDQMFMAEVRDLGGGIVACEVCHEPLLEDERHWHKVVSG